MSGSEKKTPAVSPDQGVTGETTTSFENMEAGKQTDPHEDVEWNLILKMLDNIRARDPEAYWDILIETLFKCFTRENRHKRSEKPDFLNLDRLEALDTEHLETSGSVPDDLKKRMEWVQKKEEFENYVTLLKEAGHILDMTFIIS